MNCYLCGLPLDPVKQAHFKQVIGWVEDRGSQGGSNHVRDKQYTGVFAHSTCVKHRMAPAPSGLFDERYDLESVKKERFSVVVGGDSEDPTTDPGSPPAS